MFSIDALFCHVDNFCQTFEPYFKNVNQFCSYAICAEVVDATKGIVRVGFIEIDVGHILPGNTIVGDFVEFTCSKLEFIK